MAATLITAFAATASLLPLRFSFSLSPKKREKNPSFFSHPPYFYTSVFFRFGESSVAVSVAIISSFVLHLLSSLYTHSPFRVSDLAELCRLTRP